MGKIKMRKPTPQPPHWFWADSDNCWDCNCNHNGCRGCKRLKAQKSMEQKKQKRSYKKYIDVN